MNNTSKEHRGRKAAISIIGYFLLATIYCTSITFGTLSLTVLQHNIMQVALLCFLFLVIWCIVTYNKYTVISTIALMLIAAFFLFLYYIYGETSPEFFDAISNHIYYIKELLYGRKTDELYHLILVIALCFATAFYSTIFMRKFFSFPALFIPGIVIFIADLFFKKFNTPIVYLGFVLSLAILFAVRTESKWKLRKLQKNIFGKYAFSVLPICLVAVILASFASGSFSEEAFLTKQKFSEQSINNITKARDLFFPKATENEQVSIFNFNTTGFNPNSSKLGGDISPDNTEILRVQIDFTTNKDEKLYLKGSTKDVYTGSTWKNSDDTFEPLVDGETSYIDINTTPYNTLEQNIFYKAISAAREKDEYFDFKEDLPSINIWTLNSSLNTLFNSSPNTSFTVNTFNLKKIEVNSNGDARVSPSIETGERYTFSSFKPRSINYEECYNQAYIGYFKDHEHEVRSNYKYEYKYDDIMGYNEEGTLIGEDGLEEFYNYLDELYEKYTYLPDSLPKRVSDLSYSITENSDTDYEKLKALEDYLREIPYTMSPGTVPAGRDFVDYFLFDSREGYCTYYASAMCIMSRALGYPSRFVQGYVTPQDTFSQTESMTDYGVADESGENEVIFSTEVYNLEYTVTNAQAHAWTEIYLEGMGWVQFEPTAPYASLYYDDDKGFYATTNMEEDEDFKKHLGAIGAEGKVTQYKDPEPIIDNTNLNKAAFVMLGIILTVIILIAIFIIYRYRAKQKYLINLRNMNNYSNSVIGYFNEIANLLKIDGNEKYSYETPIQFAERISEKYLSIADLDESAALYSKAYYGNNEVTLSERRKLFKHFWYLSRYMENKLGKIRYTFGYWLKKSKK